MKHRMLVALVKAAIVATAMSTTSGAQSDPVDRDRLWKIVSFKCLRHLAKSEAPIPCDSVDIAMGWDRGVALLKDATGVGRTLAVPTHVVTGIEDPAVLSPDEPNYFGVALLARAGMELRLHRRLAAEDIAIAINSRPARDQDQMHLIVDCLDPEVASTLRANLAGLDDRWRKMSAPLKGRAYWARQIRNADFSGVSPFRMLSDGIDGAKSDMASWSLAAVPVRFGDQPGFALLADHADATGGGRATDLEDPSCAIAAK